ncbi:MAG: hypothetical protein WCX17_03720 [Parcubacteria group bacterium]|jgi:hypothetical protein
MGNKLSKNEAIEFTGLDKKAFDNYLIAKEFNCLERRAGGRYYFDQDILQKWMDKRSWKTVQLTKDDYALCLDFALAQHFRSYVTSDFGTGRQREFGQKITNWVKGQLGEVAVKKFIKEKFNIDIELDFQIHDEIVPQDIIGVNVNGLVRQPKIGVGIKSSKPKNVFLVLGENEISRDDRRSDIYIFCRPEIPDDHLLRVAKEAVQALVRNEPHYNTYKNSMPDFIDLSCEVVGWCLYTELDLVTEIPGQKFDGQRYVKASGELRDSQKDWEDLVKKI